MLETAYLRQLRNLILAVSTPDIDDNVGVGILNFVTGLPSISSCQPATAILEAQHLAGVGFGFLI